jgi:hypothetical protein
VSLRRPALLLAIVAASWLAHLKGLTSPVLDYHYHRQCNTAAIARNFHENGLKLFYPQIDWEGPYNGRSATEFPLYMWLTGLLWPIAGLGELWGRLLSCAFSAGTAVYLFLFLGRRLRQDEAFYASLLFCAIPLEVYFGRTVQPEAIALFGAVASIYHWERAFTPPRSAFHWSLAVFFAFITIAHKLPYAFLLVPLAWMRWERSGKRMWTDPWVLPAAALALAAVAAWYVYASTGLYVVPSHPGEFKVMLNYRRLPYYLWFNFFSRFPELTVGWAGMPLFLIGVRSVLVERKDRLLAVWLGSAALMVAASGGYSFHHEYTQLPLVPVTAALMGAGLARLKEGVPHRGAWAKPLLWLLAVAIPVYTAIRIKHWYKIDNYEFLKNAEKAADAVSARNDLFICNERASSVYLYYLHRKGWAWSLDEQGLNYSKEWLDKRMAEGAKFYMSRKTGAFADKDDVFAKLFYSHFPVVYDFDDIIIFRLSDASSKIKLRETRSKVSRSHAPEARKQSKV